VRKLTAKVLSKVVSQWTDATLANHILRSTLTVQLVASVADRDIAVSQYAAESLLQIIKHTDDQGGPGVALSQVKEVCFEIEC